MQGDIWAVNPSTSATFYRAAAAIAGAGDVTLTTTDAGPNGIGYKIIITSAGDDTGITFTITGTKVGDLTGHAPTVEVLTGVSGDAVTSTNYWASDISIVASGASAGDVSIGTTGDVALPRTRVKGFYIVCGATAGSLKVNINGLTTGNNTVFDVSTPAGATLVQDLLLPGNGILTARQNNDYAVVVPTNLTDYTLFCG
jgi:hypothetical protein